MEDPKKAIREGVLEIALAIGFGVFLFSLNAGVSSYYGRVEIPIHVNYLAVSQGVAGFLAGYWLKEFFGGGSQ